MLVRAVFLWIGVNISILVLLAVLDGLLLVRRLVRRSPRAAGTAHPAEARGTEPTPA